MPGVSTAARFTKLAWLRRAAREAACRRGKRETLMIDPKARNAIQIDRACSAAICEEIGVRLRIRLAGEHDRLPQHLITLMDAMRTND